MQLLHVDKRTLLGEVLNMKELIERRAINYRGEDQVGTVWYGIRTDKNIYRQVEIFYKQAKEGA